MYSCPKRTWDKFLCDIAGAEKQVLLENYMFEDGRAADAVCDAVKSASSRGAEVRVMTDWAGSELSQTGKQKLIEAGAQFKTFNPPNKRWIGSMVDKCSFFLDRLRDGQPIHNKLVQAIRRSSLMQRGASPFHRTHRRITVVDQDVGWVGGMAVADAWWHGEPKDATKLIHGSYKARDTMLRVENNPVSFDSVVEHCIASCALILAVRLWPSS